MAMRNRSNVDSDNAQLGFKFLGAHAGVAGQTRAAGETALLNAPRRHHPFPDLGRGFAGAFGRDLPERHGRHFDVQVNPIQQGPGDAS